MFVHNVISVDWFKSLYQIEYRPQHTYTLYREEKKWFVLHWQLIRALLNVSSPPAYTLRLLLLFRLWWSRISFRNNKWNHPPFPIFSPHPPSFSSLHYAGSLTLFDRMCYLQPPAAVPLSLSSHRWQLNPTAACHAEAERKWWSLKREWEKRQTDRPQSTYVDVDVLASQVFCCVAQFWHSCLTVCRINTSLFKMISLAVK